MNDLSKSDQTILRLLQENAREKLETIAAETGQSVATVQRRIKHLKAAGVITANRISGFVMSSAITETKTKLIAIMEVAMILAL